MNSEMEFLPGSARDRFRDLRDKEGLTQEQLAQIAGVQVSTISKIESGATTKISSTILTAIADHFHVSTDFLLGRVDLADITTYRIEQLGLSKVAAQNLYTGVVNTDVLNELLESKRFANLTYRIDSFLEDEMLNGIAAMNQLYTNVGKLLRLNETMEAADDVLSMREMHGLAKAIEELKYDFGNCLREIKKSKESGQQEVKNMMEEEFQKMVSMVTAGGEKSIRSVTKEDMLGTMKSYFAQCIPNLTSKELDNMIEALEPLFRIPAQQEQMVNDE